MLEIPSKLSPLILALLIVFVLSGIISIGASLLLGALYALLIGHQYQLKTQWASGVILRWSVVIFGFSLNFKEILATATSSFWITLSSIVFALICGFLIGKLFKVENKLSFLIAGGTAICGGSAIAALAPAIKAKPIDIIVSISIVFLLNAIGLLVYPELGHLTHMSQADFGLWAALGIHDTSSVVGAAAAYGEESIKIATTTKLTRALWIIPLVFFAMFLFKNKSGSAKPPMFIFGFLLASLLASFIPMIQELAQVANFTAKKGMAVSLFLIGASFTKTTFAFIQWKALLQGVILWLLVSGFSLALVYWN